MNVCKYSLVLRRGAGAGHTYRASEEFMSNPQYIEIFSQKIHQFLSRFHAARRIYGDAHNDDKCYHNGEFGRSREDACINLLKNTICSSFGVSHGFVLNHSGGRTTQCDIVIHNPQHHPLEDSNTGTQFFTAESVVAIGEVKSILTPSKLYAALDKLAANKAIRDALNGPSLHDLRTRQLVDMNTEIHHTIAPFTFLICEKIEGFSNDFAQKICMHYSDKGTPRHLQHNLVISLADGVCTYDGAQVSKIIKESVGIFPYPKLKCEDEAPKPIALMGAPEDNVMAFLVNTSNSLQNAHYFYPEPTKYL